MADENTNNRFRMSLPEGWADQSTYIFDGPESGGFKHNLTLVIDNALPEDDLDLFAQERIDAVVGATPGMEILKQEKKNLPNGNEAVEAVIKWIPVDDKIIFVKKVYLIVDGVGFTFSAEFTKQTIKTIGLQVDEMINGFSPDPTG
ncbi:MAG: DcrB-related protein [Candidatus Zixiibacteriota bacterium]|nr:MAG: DcrB-related protein [candidate division Zixibacteria bacterium]